MAFRALSKPVATGLAAAVLSIGFAPSAMAVTEANTLPTTIAAPSANPAELSRALREITAPENIDPLISQAKAQHDDASAQALTDVKNSADKIVKLDAGDDLQDFWKKIKPAIIHGLRVGGPAAAKFLNLAGTILSAIPDTAPIGAGLKAAAPLVEKGSLALADLLEKIDAQQLPKAEAEKQIFDHFAGTTLDDNNRKMAADALSTIASA